MHGKLIIAAATFISLACYSVSPRSSEPWLSIVRTNGGVISVSDRTDIYTDGRIHTGHRSVLDRTVSRRGRLSAAAMKELAGALDSAAFSETVEMLATDSRDCGTMEEDTISVQTDRDGATGFCVNERDVTRKILDLIDQLEAPVIRELGSRYTTRAGDHARGAQNRV